MIQEKLRYGAHVKPTLLNLFIMVILTPVDAIWLCGSKFADVLILIKRVVTFIIAILVLIITIAIKLTSRGPVVFKQSSYAMDGKKIKIYQFSSTTTMDNGNDIKQATKGDARITSLCAFLRRTSLDELPNLLMYYKAICQWWARCPKLFPITSKTANKFPTICCAIK
jgi:hypothetical protein